MGWRPPVEVRNVASEPTVGGMPPAGFGDARYGMPSSHGESASAVVLVDDLRCARPLRRDNRACRRGLDQAM